ncbi:hypothetical protein V8C86DRAFT_3017971 [Haematococcus lacustris]
MLCTYQTHLQTSRLSSRNTRSSSACSVQKCNASRPPRVSLRVSASSGAVQPSGTIAYDDAMLDPMLEGTTLSSSSDAGERSHETDYVVVGSGIGGLCCAAMLALYGNSVTVCESHYLPGGAAHSFKVKGYTFDAGPSFFLGLTGPPGTSANPLKQVLDAVGEKLQCAQYDKWIVYSPNGTFPCVAGRQAYLANISAQVGPQALNQWLQLEKALAPLQKGAALFPAAAVRADLGMALTSARFMGPEMLQMGLVASQLTGSFGAVVDRVVTNPWLRSFLDLECFVLSGMTARDTLCAEMAFMFEERNSGRSAIEYPMGGSGAVIDALVRGLTKHGGRLLLNTHVDQVIRARKGVISNASVWNTQALLPQGAAPAPWSQQAAATPALESFMHLHLGIDASGLPADLDCHHLVVNDWQNITANNNVCIISIPTVFDPAMAPPGKHVVHAYFAANEPYEAWAGMDRRSPEYKRLKQERAEPLYKALERVIPDIRQRAELTLIASPLTHERFLRRHRGSYGPGISASTPSHGGWPGPTTPVPGLYVCGDSTMPGIGVPAAAASGMMCANTLAPVWSHLSMMDKLVPAR